MKRVLISFAIFLLIEISVFAQIKVYSVKDSSIQIKDNMISYFLPRTVLSVNVEVETEYTIPGPFSAYAEKYLSIKNAPGKRSTITEINNIDFYEYVEPDPEQCYITDAKNIVYNNIGIISGYNNSVEPEDVSYVDAMKNDFKYLQNDIYFTDYSVKRNFTGRMDTTYKVVQVDSIFQKIPIYNEVMTSKDFEQKAEEAANYIIKIRKRRFKLQSAQFETEYPPTDVKVLIDELDDLEKQYLELFIGKKIYIKNYFVFNYTPGKDIENNKIIMFHLSNELGILESPSTDSEPVYFIISKVDITKELENFYNNQSNLANANKGLYYRIPGHANIAVVYEGLIYSQKHVVLPQYGMVNYLPVYIFKNKNLQIIFDQNYGSIKSIKNK